jgi:hypothetical protein
MELPISLNTIPEDKTGDLLAKVQELETTISKLQDKPKDIWDKFQIVAALLIPASIAAVGIVFSHSQEKAQIASAWAQMEAEIESTQAIADAQEEVAKINARVNQAQLVHSFMDFLLRGDPAEQNLAIKAVMIALPEKGPDLLQQLSENEFVLEGIRTLARMEVLLDQVDALPDGDAYDILKNPPSELDVYVLTAIKGRLGGKTIADSDAVLKTTANAEALLKMVLVLLSDHSEKNLDKWEAAVAVLRSSQESAIRQQVSRH